MFIKIELALFNFSGLVWSNGKKIILFVFIPFLASLLVFLIRRYDFVFFKGENLFDYMTIVVNLLMVYGIFFGFMQFAVSINNKEYNFFGINKLNLIIFNKFCFSLLNSFWTRVSFIALIILPVVFFVAHRIIPIVGIYLGLGILSYILSLWELCVYYLITLFGFLLVQSINATFVIVNDKNYGTLESQIKRKVLHETLQSLKNDSFWDYFDYKMKTIAPIETIAFANHVFNAVLHELTGKLINISRNTQESDEKRIKFFQYWKDKKKEKSISKLVQFINKKWGGEYDFSITEQLMLLRSEVKYLNDLKYFCDNKAVFDKFVARTSDLLSPFYNLALKVKDHDNMYDFIKILLNCDYADQIDTYSYSFYNNKHCLHQVQYALFDCLYDNFENVDMTEMRPVLGRYVEKHKGFVFEYLYNRRTFCATEKNKEFIKALLSLLDLNYIYAFILYNVLHTGSGSEIAMKEEIIYFKKLCSQQTMSYTNNELIGELVESTNLGHRIKKELIIWLLLHKDLEFTNKIAEDIYNKPYLDFSLFLKIKYIFSQHNIAHYYSEDLETSKLLPEIRNGFIRGYFGYLSSKLYLLDEYFFFSHHEIFLKKFKSYFVAYVEENCYHSDLNHVTLYLLKEIPEMKQYFSDYKFIRGDSDYPFVDDVFLDFAVVVFDEPSYYRIFSKNEIIVEKLKLKLGRINTPNKRSEYLSKIWSQINGCTKLKKSTEGETAIFEFLEAQVNH